MSQEFPVQWVEPKAGPTILVVGVLTLVLASVGFLVADPLAALSVVVGAVLVVAFFLAGAWVVAKVSRYMPEMLLAVGLVSYALRLMAVLGILFVLRAAGLTPLWIALGVAVAVVGWLVSMTVTVVRMRPGLGGVRPGSGKP